MMPWLCVFYTFIIHKHVNVIQMGNPTITSVFLFWQTLSNFFDKKIEIIFW
jgi:hypothetical protein